MMNSGVTAEVFRSTFEEVIRVGLNWDRFIDERWPIEEVTIESNDDLERCFMPWFIGKGGEEVAYDHPEAVPMRLVDVPKADKLLNDERREDIRKYVDEYKRHASDIEFIAPTYALPDDQYFLLDRNHRLSALTFAPVKFRVTLWNIRGPLDKDGLLDLIHWDGTHAALHGSAQQ
jgi:hypothetical protein